MILTGAVDGTVETWLAVLAAVGGVIAFVWRVLIVALRTRDRLNEYVRRFDVMWRAFTTRGEVEAEKSGIRELPDQPGNQVPAYARERFAGLADRMREAYRAEWSALSTDEAKLRIEERFGPEMIAQVCRPLLWHGGQCLQAAWLIAREPVGYTAPDSKQVHR